MHTCPNSASTNGSALVQYMAATAFVYSLHKAGKEGKSARLLWMGLPTRAEVKPFVDVGWKLLSRTLFKMIAYAAITAAATKLETNVVASHQVRSRFAAQCARA